jgi:predicted ATPase
LSGTLYFLGGFEPARQYSISGLQIWRSGGVRSQVEQVTAPAVACLYYKALSEWHIGEIASSQVSMAEGISLAKELHDMHGLAVSLYFAAFLGHFERSPSEVERCASKMIELSTSQNFALWMGGGAVLRGWARTVSGDIPGGISSIEHGLDDYRATGTVLTTPFLFALKSEALHLAGRTPEALEAIREAEAVIDRTEERWWCAELYRLRGVFLAALGADEIQTENAFLAAISTAREQKSISLTKRAETTYSEYCCQKAEVSGMHEFRLALW